MLETKFVPDDKAEALKAIAKKSNGNFSYSGFVRGFILSDAEPYWIDTRFDDELRAAGIID